MTLISKLGLILPNEDAAHEYWAPMGSHYWVQFLCCPNLYKWTHTLRCCHPGVSCCRLIILTSWIVMDASTMIVVPVSQPWHHLCHHVVQGYEHPGHLPVLRCRAVKGGCMGVMCTSLVVSHSTSLWEPSYCIFCLNREKVWQALIVVGMYCRCWGTDWAWYRTTWHTISGVQNLHLLKLCRQEDYFGHIL